MSEASEPRRLGDFEVLGELGSGTQGTVLRGRCAVNQHDHIPLGTIVALKVLRLSPGENAQDKIAPYISLIGPSPHPGVIAYLDAFVEEKQAVLVLEYVEGVSLAERLKSFKHGSWAEMKPLVLQIVDALIAICDNGMIHRDVKPSNIFVTPGDVVKLIDLDLAPNEEEAAADEEKTVVWQGSLEYMAPDFLSVPGFQGDAQSDLFSTGILLFQCLTGRMPFPSLGERPDIGFVERWQKGPPSVNFRLSAFRILDHAREVVAKALNPDRTKRYENFREFRTAIETIRPTVLTFNNGDKYELISMLGKGGFGEVFQARRQRDGEVFAVKHLTSSDYAKRFLKEAEILKDYPHETIVAYEDLLEGEQVGPGGEPDYHLVMEYLPGATLNHRLRDEPDGLDPQEAMKMFVRYLRGLDHLHNHPQQIIHRDIKPGNLYSPENAPEQAKIFDLGIARDVTGTETFGHIPGTLAYMPPEFARADGGRGTPQSDIYAMGFCLYETLVGESVAPKLPRDMDQAYIAYFKRSQRPLVIDFDKPVFRRYPGLMRVVGYALAYDVDARYSTAGVMADDLEKILLPETGQVEDYDVTLANMIGPKTVINEAFAKQHMPEVDVMPKILPSEAIKKKEQQAKRRKALGMVFTFLLISAAVGLVAGYIFRPEPGAQGPTLDDLTGRQQALLSTYQELDPAIQGAPTAESLDVQYIAFTNWQGRLERVDTNLLALVAPLQTGLVVRANSLFSTRLGSSRELLQAGDYAAVTNELVELDALSDFAARRLAHTNFPEQIDSLRRDMAARQQGELMQAAEKADAIAAVTKQASLVTTATYDNAPEVLSDFAKLYDSTPEPLRQLPEWQDQLSEVQTFFPSLFVSELSRRDDLPARAGRLAELRSRVDDPRWAIVATRAEALRSDLAKAEAMHLLEVHNPHDVPIRLASDVLSAKLAPASTVLFDVNIGATPVSAAFRYIRDDGYAPQDVTVALAGGQGSRIVVPSFSLESVRVELVNLTMDPPVRAELRSGESAWRGFALGVTNLMPGAWSLRFSREDFLSIERPLVLDAGQEEAEVLMPGLSEWEGQKGPALTQLLALESAVGAQSFSQADAHLAALRANPPRFPDYLQRYITASRAVDDWKQAQSAMAIKEVESKVAGTRALRDRYLRSLFQLSKPDLISNEVKNPWSRDEAFPQVRDLMVIADDKEKALLSYDGTPSAVALLKKKYDVESGDILTAMGAARDAVNLRFQNAMTIPGVDAGMKKSLPSEVQAELAHVEIWAELWPSLLGKTANAAAAAREKLAARISLADSTSEAVPLLRLQTAGTGPLALLARCHADYDPDLEACLATLKQLDAAQKAGADLDGMDLHLALRAAVILWNHYVDSIDNRLIEKNGDITNFRERFRTESDGAKEAADLLRPLIADADEADVDLALWYLNVTLPQEGSSSRYPVGAHGRWLVLLKGLERLYPEGTLYDARRLNMIASYLTGTFSSGNEKLKSQLGLNSKKIAGLAADF